MEEIKITTVPHGEFRFAKECFDSEDIGNRNDCLYYPEWDELDTYFRRCRSIDKFVDKHTRYTNYFYSGECIENLYNQLVALFTAEDFEVAYTKDFALYKNKCTPAQLEVQKRRCRLLLNDLAPIVKDIEEGAVDGVIVF